VRYNVIPQRRPRLDPGTQLTELLAHVLALVELELDPDDLVALAYRFVEPGRASDLANGLTTCEAAIEVLNDWREVLEGQADRIKAELEAEYGPMPVPRRVVRRDPPPDPEPAA
jgi:hypothetical protein